MRRPILAMCFATVFWGVNFPLAKIATNEFDPFFIAAVRILFAATVFFFLLPAGIRPKLVEKGILRKLLLLSASGILINQLAFINGIHRTTPGHSAVLMAMIPIFVGLLGWILLREKVPMIAWLGVLLGGAGAVGVILSGRTEAREATLVGDLLVLCATLAFSFYTVWGRAQVREHGALFITAGAYIGAAPVAVLLLIFGLTRQDWSVVTWKGASALAYMLVFTTVLCFLAYFYALGKMKAVQVAVFADMQPILGTGLSMAMGMDIAGPLFLGSAAMGLVGVLIVQLGPVLAGSPRPRSP